MRYIALLLIMLGSACATAGSHKPNEGSSSSWRIVNAEEAPISILVPSSMRKDTKQWIGPHGGEYWHDKRLRMVISYGYWGQNSFEEPWFTGHPTTTINGLPAAVHEYHSKGRYGIVVILTTVLQRPGDAHNPLIDFSSSEEADLATLMKMAQSIKEK